MVRIEHLLLALLLVCTAAVGALTWQSRTRRAERLAAQAPARAEAGHSSDPGPSEQLFSSSSNTDARHVRSEIVPSSLAAPARDLPRIRRQIESNARSTYIGYMLERGDSSISRWPDRSKIAVKVWIQDGTSLARWSAELASIAERAFGAWQEFDIPLRFQMVRDSASAEIIVAWTDRFGGAQVGSTRRARDQHGWILRAEITLALELPSGAPLDRQMLGAVAIHEVGHALGIDHSPDAADIMAARNDGVFAPTRADRATLALIYSLPPGSLK